MRHDCRGLRGLDLLREARVIKTHQQVVAFVGRAANRITHNDHAVAEVYRVKHGRQHADVGLGARDDQRVRLALSQMRKRKRSSVSCR